jgi:hypothetical protein
VGKVDIGEREPVALAEIFDEPRVAGLLSRGGKA